MARLPHAIGGRFGLKEQSSRSARPLNVTDLANSGNRAQRRFAKKKIANIARQNAKRNAKAAGHG